MAFLRTVSRCSVSKKYGLLIDNLNSGFGGKIDVNQIARKTTAAPATTILQDQTKQAVQPTPKDPLDLTFEDAKAAFKSKTNWELLRALVVYQMCSYETIVKNNMRFPSSPAEWEEIAQQFDDKWNFPNCLGAIDGKHVVLQAPIKSGSDFFNYKSQFSIVLMAVVDADYNFIYVDIGCQGRVSDGGVFQHCELYQRLMKNSLNFPAPRALYGRTKELPYVFVGDAAFPLTENLMKPYQGAHTRGSPERIFNYRLSRARRIVENSFGIMSSVFRVLRKPMLLEADKATLIVMTVVCLHNFLRRSKSSRGIYTPAGALDTEVAGRTVSGTWRDDRQVQMSFLPLRNIPRRHTNQANAVRDEFRDYFTTSGIVPWQEKCA